MSMNVHLHGGQVPYLVSPYENFFFIVPHVKLNVESGNGYPGQGGCFYGQEGKCFVSQYRAVFVADAPQTAYKSFSLPFYAIRDWQFHTTMFGAKSWKGHVNQIPGGGLVSIGTFHLQFLSHGVEEFQAHVRPVLQQSRKLHEQFANLSVPSVLMVPGKLESDAKGKVQSAYYAPEDPFTIFIISSI